MKYLLEIGVAQHTGEIGSRFVLKPSRPTRLRLGSNLFPRTPADFAVLKSIGKDATDNEKRLVELFGEKDDVLSDFEFTPIHTAVLDLYTHDDRERPSLEEYIDSSPRDPRLSIL